MVVQVLAGRCAVVRPLWARHASPGSRCAAPLCASPRCRRAPRAAPALQFCARGCTCLLPPLSHPGALRRLGSPDTGLAVRRPQTSPLWGAHRPVHRTLGSAAPSFPGVSPWCISSFSYSPCFAQLSVFETKSGPIWPDFGGRLRPNWGELGPMPAKVGPESSKFYRYCLTLDHVCDVPELADVWHFLGELDPSLSDLGQIGPTWSTFSPCRPALGEFCMRELNSTTTPARGRTLLPGCARRWGRRFSRWLAIVIIVRSVRTRIGARCAETHLGRIHWITCDGPLTTEPGSASCAASAPAMWPCA